MLNKINQFADKLNHEICDNMKVIRGFTWFNCKIEFWGCEEVVVRLTFPQLENVKGVEKLYWSMKDHYHNMVLFVTMNTERFEKLINNQDKINDDEWIFEDEVETS